MSVAAGCVQRSLSFDCKCIVGTDVEAPVGIESLAFGEDEGNITSYFNTIIYGHIGRKGEVLSVTLVPLGFVLHGGHVNYPLGIQNYILIGCYLCLIVIFRSAAVLLCIPTGEIMTLPTECIRLQGCCFVLLDPLGEHQSAAAVGVECDFLHFRMPLGIQGCVLFERGCIGIGIGISGSVGLCVPACEEVFFLGKPVLSENRFNVFYDPLGEHPSGTAVGIILDFHHSVETPLGI